MKRPSPPSRRSGAVKLGAACLGRCRDGWQAAPTKPWRVGTARRRGCGERGGKAYARNRRSTPLKDAPARNLADLGRRRRAPVSLIYGGGELPGMSAGGGGGRGDVLRGSHGDVAGAESGASSAERSTSEHGNHPWFARMRRGQRCISGRAHRRPSGQGWSGAVVVVAGVTTCRGGRESAAGVASPRCRHSDPVARLFTAEPYGVRVGYSVLKSRSRQFSDGRGCLAEREAVLAA